MKGKAIPFLILAGLCLASTAMALDFNRRPATTLPERSGGFELNALYQCDNDTPSSGLYQDSNERYGNVFSLPVAGERISQVQFVHYGFGFAGPYQYDIEYWDAATCTYIGGVNNLVAQNAANVIRTETVDVSAFNQCLTGDVIVSIQPKTCAPPPFPPGVTADCYPDLLYDDQFFVTCPVIVVPSSGLCVDASQDIGPFLLRATTDACIPTSSTPSSWGKVKTLYR